MAPINPPSSIILPRAATSSQLHQTSTQLHEQWLHPKDVFSILLLLGADVIQRAIAQTAGGIVTPIAFSFGWVAYSVSALVSAVGENKLMPSAPDCPSIVINGYNGYARNNYSWILGRVVRDFQKWMHPQVAQKLSQILEEKRNIESKKSPFPQLANALPPKGGLCISIYKAKAHLRPGEPMNDFVYYSGFAIAFLQLCVASIPFGCYGDWSVLAITASGIVLAFLTGSLPQWKKEKWSYREGSTKDFILTKGNGSQHAIVILGSGHSFDLEDLAASDRSLYNTSTSFGTRIAITSLAILWILLLLTAAGAVGNPWFLLAVGGIGTLQNVAVAGLERDPSAFGIHLEFVEVIGKPKVMQALFDLEEKYPRLGYSMLATFFPGKLTKEEERKWAELEESFETRKKNLRDSSK